MPIVGLRSCYFRASVYSQFVKAAVLLYYIATSLIIMAHWVIHSFTNRFQPIFAQNFIAYAFVQCSKIKPIMLSISWLCLAKCCSIAVFCYFTDCSIRVSQCGCCKACLTSKTSKGPMYSVALHVFSCSNIKLCVLRQSLWQKHCAV